MKRQQQELLSTAYTIFPAFKEFKFISYFDSDAMAMGYTIVDSNMIEMLKLSDLPVEIIIEFGKFVEEIEHWQSNPEKEFPFTGYAGSNVDTPEIRSASEGLRPSDFDVDGSEAELT